VKVGMPAEAERESAPDHGSGCSFGCFGSFACLVASRSHFEPAVMEVYRAFGSRKSSRPCADSSQQDLRTITIVNHYAIIAPAVIVRPCSPCVWARAAGVLGPQERPSVSAPSHWPRQRYAPTQP